MKKIHIKPQLFSKKTSLFEKYQDLCVGKKGIIAFLGFELLSTPFRSIKGALGYYLRNRCAKYLFKRLGKNIIFGNDLGLFSPHKISLGDKIVISDGCRLDVKGDDSTAINLGNNILVGANSILRSRAGGTINLENDIDVGDNCIIAARNGSVYMGNNVLMGAFSYIMGGQAHAFENTHIPIAQQTNTKWQNVVIEDDVWIGSAVKILAGTTIGKGSIIGAGAVVTKNIPEFSIAAGVPARVIKNRKQI